MCTATRWQDDCGNAHGKNYHSKEIGEKVKSWESLYFHRQDKSVLVNIRRRHQRGGGDHMYLGCTQRSATVDEVRTATEATSHVEEIPEIKQDTILKRCDHEALT